MIKREKSCAISMSQQRSFIIIIKQYAIDASNLSIRNTSHLESRRELLHCIDDTLTCFFFLLEILAEG